ncbi:MAG TPA: hypothetical protein VJ984_13155 [Xanthomonadales bacterium]|nr:hypothetical protein [Xanthomonadales bacterium]
MAEEQPASKRMRHASISADSDIGLKQKPAFKVGFGMKGFPGIQKTASAEAGRE